MEPAEIPEATEEECSSNESGWTVYIASPCSNYSDQNYQGSEVLKENKDVVYGGSKDDSGDNNNNNNGDSDDSMASDACSGKAAGNKKSSAAKKKLHQKEEGKNVKVGREEALRANKSSHGRHNGRAFLQKKSN